MFASGIHREICRCSDGIHPLHAKQDCAGHSMPTALFCGTVQHAA